MRTFVAILTVALAGCGPDEQPQPTDPQEKETPECTIEGLTRCDGLLVQVCAEGAWSEAVPCAGQQRCRVDSCVDPSAAQLAHLGFARAYVDAQLSQSAWPEPLDGPALYDGAETIILDGDGSTMPYLRAMRSIHLGVRQGHQSLYDASCDAPLMPLQSTSRFGVCGRPYGDSMVVTFAKSDNALSLEPGDLIEGPDLLEEAARRPMCGASSPSDSHHRTAAASTFFGHVPAGTELTVQRAGESFTITIPDTHDAIDTNCTDPLGRDIAFNAQSYIRPDGVAVIRLPRFFPIDMAFPQNPTPEQIQALMDHMQQAVIDAFEPVKDAPAIVWDARSNGGGITPVGMAIASGMPGAQAMDLSYCQYRIADSNPPSFSSQTYAHYQITPGGPFAYSGKVAVLIDGLDYSAADYFPLAVARATDALLVGTPTAGAYGASSVQIDFAGPPWLGASLDVNRCVESATGQPLEGYGVEPDLHVEYEPVDLAAGVDTVLETAVSALTR